MSKNVVLGNHEEAIITINGVSFSLQEVTNISSPGATSGTAMPSTNATAMGNSISGQADSGTMSQGCVTYPHHVVAVRKDTDGNLSMFKLEDGTVLDYGQCLDYIHQGQLNLIATEGKSGALIIRSQADGDPYNNLSNLPIF